jgi:hypothetical protein
MKSLNTYHPPGPGIGPLIQQLLHAIHVATGSGEYKRCGAILWKIKKVYKRIGGVEA